MTTNLRPRHRLRWTRTGALLAAVAVAVAACGDGGGDLAAVDDESAFCELVAQMEAEVPEGEATAADYRRLARGAPAEVRGDLEAMAEAFAELDGYEQDDPEGFAAAMEVLSDPDYQAAAERVERYLVDVCGMDVDGVGGDEVTETAVDAADAAFCAALTVGPGGLEHAESSQAYRDLAAAAPDVISADLDRMADWMAEFEAYEDEEEALGRAFELASDPEYQAVEANIERYVTDVCGSGSTAMDGTDAVLDDADWDDTDFDDIRILGVAGGEVDAKVAELFGDRAVGQGRDSDNGHVDLRIDVLDLTVAEALAACAELASFLADHPDAQGTAALRLAVFDWDDPDGWDDPANDLAVNDLITPADSGTCREAS